MRVGLLVSSISNFGQMGFYNNQENGLAKALSDYFEQVIVYKSVPLIQKNVLVSMNVFDEITITRIPSSSIGVNGFFDVKVLDKTLDVLIYFSDTQILLPKVYKWAVKNNIRFFPYIGVIESHSKNRLKKLLIDSLFHRNIRIYKRCRCLVKTPKVKEDLGRLGVQNTTLAPVGVDLSLLRNDYKEYDTQLLKEKYGYSQENKIILFVGRLTKEKEPIQMIEIFGEILKSHSEYRLLMVGSGELKEKVVLHTKKIGIVNYVKMIDRIPNSEIWELYRIADTFVNLNKQEIYGMAILEAMYYGCKVVAWTAPGPNFIIENGVSGWLVNSTNQLIDKVFDQSDLSSAAHRRITQTLGWSTTAKIIKNIVYDI
jgi:1,2-diacylglycerol 3-alpha-glucosyltransferase